MTIITHKISIKNEELILTNQRALYWQGMESLIVSDVHIGKTAHFRKHGIPMPNDVLLKDLERLKQLILYFKVKTIVIVGDLFHAEQNSDINTFKAWRTQFEDLKLILIKGNHDRQPKHLFTDLNITVVNKLMLPPFLFIHEAVDTSSDYISISGHTHPGVLIRGKGRQKVKLPCYQVSSSQLILPAFSLFTGLNTRDKQDSAVCYAFTDSNIFKL